jgi:hypothetical protein
VTSFRLLVAIGLALCLTALAAGCGGGGSSSQVDQSGFSNSDRQLANQNLSTLDETSIPGTIVQLTATIGLPAVCRVHFAGAGSKNLDVILSWIPVPRSGNAFTWFKLTVSPNGVIPSSMHLGITQTKAELRSHYGVAYSPPFDPCQIDAFGRVTAVPLTLAGYPATGRKRKIPQGD